MHEVTDILKNKAYLFVSGELSEKDRLAFEKELETNAPLSEMVDEISSSLNLTKTAFTAQPTDTFLQSQRLIL